jgi:hypothetical protein
MLVNILPPSDPTVVCDRFETNFLGLQDRQDFHVINLWEVDQAEAKVIAGLIKGGILNQRMSFALQSERSPLSCTFND